ncbi:hypothetical protein TNCT_601951 [Trichonephila clavata]|uniref:Endonuclease/exonuclease/phosphatase domain-containing protein n=1 Tax=Trichonephila clavata TaxID=2740835 RepID=A0A8X6HGN5_TRICU|nr:hypothetical protein TNCT_601951 [Trichonephila clavata]
MEGLFKDNTIILDFTAKNTIWGSAITNASGSELSNLVNDKAFLSLNDDIHTFRSNSYLFTDILDLRFISPSLFPYSSRRVLGNIGSDHLLISSKTLTGGKNFHWNFKKIDWSLFENISNDLISQKPVSDNLKKEIVPFQTLHFYSC